MFFIGILKFIRKVILKKNVWYVFIRFYYKKWNQTSELKIENIFFGISWERDNVVSVLCVSSKSWKFFLNTLYKKTRATVFYSLSHILCVAFIIGPILINNRYIIGGEPTVVHEIRRTRRDKSDPTVKEQCVYLRSRYRELLKTSTVFLSEDNNSWQSVNPSGSRLSWISFEMRQKVVRGSLIHNVWHKTGSVEVRLISVYVSCIILLYEDKVWRLVSVDWINSGMWVFLSNGIEEKKLKWNNIFGITFK